MKFRQLLSLCLVALLLAGTALAATPVPAFARPAAAPGAVTDEVSGSYVSNVYPAASAPGLVVLMSLYPNNNAEVVSFYFSNPPITERGTWEVAGDEVTVTLTENDNGQYDTPSIETFAVHDGMLVSGAFTFHLLDEVTPGQMEAAAGAPAAGAGADVAAGEALTETVAADAGADVAAGVEITATEALTGSEEMSEEVAGAAYEVFATGVYPAADASGMVTIMALYPNMNMEQLTVYLGTGTVHEVGMWSEAAGGYVDVTVTGTFDREYETPVTTSYAREGDVLSDGVFTFHQLDIVTPADMEAMVNPAGTYVSRLYPAADASGLLMVLSLFANNNAEQVSIYAGKGTVVEQGTWAENDDGSVAVSITGTAERTYASPAEITYMRDRDVLSDGTFEFTRVEQVTPAEMAAAADARDAAAGDAAGDATGGEGTADAGLTGTAWVWTETLMSDDTTITPVEADAFRLEFGAGGSVSSTTDCNTNAGSYTVDGNRIEIDMQISTMMACPNDAQEAVYIRDLTTVQSYLLADGNLVLELPLDSGSMIFVPAE
jgi:heat shock protein HslJ